MDGEIERVFSEFPMMGPERAYRIELEMMTAAVARRKSILDNKSVGGN
jgi:hypothetical protein